MQNRFPEIITDRPVLVFGGPYSNRQATLALLETADRRGFGADQMICTGDLTAYCGAPRATIEMIAARGIAVVMGNCDEQLARDADNCGCGFEEGSECDRLSAAWYAYASREVTDDQRAYLATLPRRIDLVIGGVRLAVVHGRLDQINAFVFPGTEPAVKAADLAHAQADGIIAGHSGLPFTDVIDGKVWHNAGVIGMPANDATPRVWFSVITPNGDGSLTFAHEPLVYDVAAAQAEMRAAGLPRDYHDALETGVWPSVDILPATDQARTGSVLSPVPVTVAPLAAAVSAEPAF